MSTSELRNNQMYYFYGRLLDNLSSLGQEVQRSVLMRIWQQLRDIPSLRLEFEKAFKEDNRDLSLENYAAVFGMALTPGGITPVIRRALNHLGFPPLRDNTGPALSYQEFLVDLKYFLAKTLPKINADQHLSLETKNHIDRLTQEFLDKSESMRADNLIKQKLKEARQYVPGLRV